MWVVMRCDYSSVLVSGGYTIVYYDLIIANLAAQAVSGHIVKWKVAKKILTINRMIEKRHEIMLVDSECTHYTI